MNKIFTKQPRVAWTITGALVGAALGLFVIGNFGVAARGNAIGIAGWAFGGTIGAYIGYRIGEWFSKRATKSNSQSD